MNYFQVKPTKNLSEPNHFYLCLAILWTLIIAVLCLVSFNDLPSIGIKGSNIDKYIHFVFHFGFTMFWFLYLKARNKVSLFKIFIASFLYGIAIEIAQGLFTTTRSADVLDVIANLCGSTIAIGMISLLPKFYNKKI